MSDLEFSLYSNEEAGMTNRKSGNSHPKAARLVSVNSMPKNAVSQTAMNDHRLHLVMDKESYAKLQWLKASLEASSDSEVIRRALQAYEIFEPADADRRKGVPSNLSASPVNDSVEHLYIRISQRMKERLDTVREISGLSYGEQVRHALRILSQFARDRAEILKNVQDEDTHDIDSELSIQSQLCCELSKKYGGNGNYLRIMATC